MEWAYLGSNIISMSLWGVLFWLRQDLRRPMLTMSLLAIPLALFDIVFVPTYWQPVTIFDIPVGIEGFIFSFSMGGIASVIYIEVANRRLRHIGRKYSLHAVWLPLLTFALFLLSEVFGSPNPEISAYIAVLASVLITLILRRDLLQSAILGSVIFGVIYFLLLKLWIVLFPGAYDWFTFQRLAKLYIWGVPGWEAIFGFIFAAYWVNLYELIFGYRLTPTKTESRAPKAPQRRR
jgi:hypothetical protein